MKKERKHRREDWKDILKRVMKYKINRDLILNRLKQDLEDGDDEAWLPRLWEETTQKVAEEFSTHVKKVKVAEKV